MTQAPHQIEGISASASKTDSRPGHHQPSPPPLVDLSVSSSLIPSSFASQASPDPTIDNHFIVMHSTTTWAAFMCIVNLLQLNCMQDSGFNIRAPACTLPPPIVPTVQQQMVPHKPYVDMLPWSSLRDRILNSLTTINELEFVLDMADFKVWGSTPWDPMAWEVGPEFARKWWFLMDDGIMHATNFWRAQRGEEALVLAPP